MFKIMQKLKMNHFLQQNKKSPKTPNQGKVIFTFLTKKVKIKSKK
jgi:hypothetical protein